MNKESSIEIFGVLYTVFVIIFLLSLFSGYCYIGKGNSMEPTLSDFDLIFALPVSSKKIQPGDIVAVKIKDITIIHRLIEKSTDKIVTKGDNLEFPESFSFSEISSLKKVIFVIKKGLFLIIGAGIPILSAGIIVLLRSKRPFFICFWIIKK